MWENIRTLHIILEVHWEYFYRTIMKRNITSGTNSAGLGPVAFRMAVRMSNLLKPLTGSIDKSVEPKVSWKI